MVNLNKRETLIVALQVLGILTSCWLVFWLAVAVGARWLA